MTAVLHLERGKLDELLRRSGELKRIAIKFGSVGEGGGPTGVHPDSEDGETIAGVLAKHEFGQGVPERPVVRAVVNGKRAELSKAVAAGAVAMVDTKASREAVMSLVGDRAVELLLEAHDALGVVQDDDGQVHEALEKTGAIRGSLRWAESD